MGSLKNKCKQNFQQTYHHRKGPNMFLRMQDLLFLKGGIWDFNEKMWQDLGLKVCMQGMQNAKNNHWD